VLVLPRSRLDAAPVFELDPVVPVVPVVPDAMFVTLDRARS
jgi:hypothetical protein